MSASIITNKGASTEKGKRAPALRWPGILMWSVLAALLALAIWMRSIGLNLPFDRDGYDEGVYWQSLMAMRAGYTLYGQIFYSQPPFFLLSTYPLYILLGGSLWSARLSIAVVSLVGLPGAFLLGMALKGRLGAVLATLLLVADPLYLSLSQKIEAEVSSAAFSLLAVGAAYLWWESSEGTVSLVLAVLCGIALPLGILCKLLSLTSLLPIGLLVVARLWQYWQKKPGITVRSLRTILLAVATSIIVTLLVFLPYFGSLYSMLREVVSFHTHARAALINERVQNGAMFRAFFTAALPLTIAAVYGFVAACIRRDWRILPLTAWLLITMYMLWIEAPLFSRHFIALIPPLIGMAILGLGDSVSLKQFFARFTMSNVMTALAIILIVIVIALDIPTYQPYYRAEAQQGSVSATAAQMHIANDLRNAITPDQLVITDGQFIAALADRNTPPSLVDTSMVRIASGYLTQQQLINAAQQPDVHAVLFYSTRLRMSQVAGFYSWVTQHFHLKYRYGPQQELWIR